MNESCGFLEKTSCANKPHLCVCSSLCVIVDFDYSVYSLFSHLLHLLYELYVAVRDTRWFPHIACVSIDPGFRVFVEGRRPYIFLF
ncbi:hypothetical protein HanXRQr2_Chr12g0540031 [Helianthus annuus]|uniref:Uncharacterized protein n=1 Tax=Helianthus annuus TaxID=4232 RepID=A0A9K3HGC0_HELAN|nr:hypothetical protein HanXRQr2_Chr12g0540031 [Helianthus annuus]KAJ0862579.1 hypothetical protein HanPSC8_Chr12g0519831 [Helianthus annuus]